MSNKVFVSGCYDLLHSGHIAFFQERVRQSYGVSGRFTLERAAIFRADFGFSEDGLNFSAGFGLPF